jgi:hypothetical protein
LPSAAAGSDSAALASNIWVASKEPSIYDGVAVKSVVVFGFVFGRQAPSGTGPRARTKVSFNHLFGIAGRRIGSSSASTAKRSASFIAKRAKCD